LRGRRAALYRQANTRVLQVLPGVPLAQTKEQVALYNGVQGFITSPFGPESFAGVSVTRWGPYVLPFLTKRITSGPYSAILRSHSRRRMC